MWDGCACVQVDWEEVKKEMVEEKGLQEEVANVIGEYVKLHGGFELVEKLASDARLVAVENAVAGLQDMRLLLQYCDNFGVLDKVSVGCVRECGVGEGGWSIYMYRVYVSRVCMCDV